MARWIKEIVVIAFVAALAAVALPRLVLSSLGPLPRRAPRAATRAQSPAAPPPAVAIESLPLLADPTADDAPTSAAPVNAASTASMARHSRPTRATAVTGAAANLPPGALTRRGGRWVVDMRVVPSVRSALSSVRLEPLGTETAPGQGYRVQTVDRMGLLAMAGVRRGDVLTGVSGMPLRNPDDALEAYARLRHATQATFEFVRNGSRFQVPVDVVGHAPGAALGPVGADPARGQLPRGPRSTEHPADGPTPPHPRAPSGSAG